MTADLHKVLAFVEATYFSQSIPELLYKSADYFMHALKLNNCAIQLYDTHHRAITNGSVSAHYRAVEERITPVLRDRKTSYSLRQHSQDPASHYLAYIQCDVAAFPILVNNDLIGTLFLYSHTPVHEHAELIEALLRRLTRVAMHVKGYTEVKHSAMTDALTGLYNKAYLQDAATRSLAEQAKHEQPTSLVLIDLDNFKHYNDTKGHLAGDQLLKELAKTIKECALPTHVPARFGGEEFVILLPNTNQTAASDWAEHLRNSIEKKSGATASIGVCTCMRSKSTYSAILRCADEAMYSSKRYGKNRVTHRIILDPSLAPVEKPISTRSQQHLDA